MIDTLHGTAPLVAWYGDDYTGSAACMEVLTFAGVPSVLFLAPPTPDQIARFGDTRGIGLAGSARSQGRDWRQDNLPAIFQWLADSGARVKHFKICSTFDSSPEIGSIGHAADIAASVLGGWMPVFPASPEIRRYQAFGNLFASEPSGVTRLDRHPVMNCHPVTPMDEADVRRVLAQQTMAQVGLISLEDLRTPDAADKAVLREVSSGFKLVAVDTVSHADLEQVGRLLWNTADNSMLAIGSQGVEYALVAHWQRLGLLDPVVAIPGAGIAAQMIVVSGSVSDVTARQIDHAAAHGFCTVPLDMAACLLDKLAVHEAINRATEGLSAGRSVLIFSAKGPADPALGAFRSAAERRGLSSANANQEIGAILGDVLSELLDRTNVRRAAISGGDTSSHATEKLGIYALTALAPTTPGAALCRAYSEQGGRDGLELALKGGQMGSLDYFEWIRRGGGPARGMERPND